MQINKRLTILIFLLLLTQNLLAKDIVLKIMDKDIDIPLEGVKITSSQIEEMYFTNAEGKISIPIDETLRSITLTYSSPGYETKKSNIKEFDKEITIILSMGNVLEGKELLIEESYYTKKDKVGTSILVDKEELKTLAMRGTIEDVFSSIKTLPGVSFTANFMTDLSIRGGHPEEIVASLDGFIIRHPFYWGSSTSIFNPNIVDSVIFNNGVFNVKYGMSNSGLLEVGTKKPNQGLKIFTNMAISTIEAYIQTPIGLKNAGLMFGARATYLETTMGLIWLAQGVDVPRVPYIYSGDMKWFWKPNERIELYVNGFIGADGIGMGSTNDESENIELKDMMLNDKLHAIAFSGIKILPNDKIFIHYFAGYEFLSSNYTYNATESGTKDLSIDIDLETDAAGHHVVHSMQTRLDLDFEIHKYIVLGVGGGLIYDFHSRDSESSYLDSELGLEITDNVNFGNSNQFNTSVYLNFNFNPIPEKLEIELGCRLDHFTASMEKYSVNSYPAANPRFYIAYTPIRNKKFMDYLTISLGVGLYSMMPSFTYTQEDPIVNLSIKQQKVLSNVLGLEILFPYGIKTKVEGYYKYYFDRYYENTEIVDGNTEYINHSNGIGHVAGFDLILKKKISRYFDGWISYSFIYARYYNPNTDDTDWTDDDEPTGIWYYPSYHRWHSINFVINIKPTPWLTISPTFGIHTGIPKTTFGDKIMYTDASGQLELYKRTEEYSDKKRTLPSFPLSIKVEFHHYFPKSKIKIEIYAAIDNILAIPAMHDSEKDKYYPVYNPDQNEKVDKYTGDIVLQDPAPYDVFTPSFGVKLSY